MRAPGRSFTLSKTRRISPGQSCVVVGRRSSSAFTIEGRVGCDYIGDVYGTGPVAEDFPGKGRDRTDKEYVLELTGTRSSRSFISCAIYCQRKRVRRMSMRTLPHCVRRCRSNISGGCFRRLHFCLVEMSSLSDKRAMRLVLKIAKPVLDYALPERCPSCGVISTDGTNFCAKCWPQIRVPESSMVRKLRACHLTMSSPTEPGAPSCLAVAAQP